VLGSFQLQMSSSPNIYVAGHNGMVGSAIIRSLIKSGIPKQNIIIAERNDLNLLDQNAVSSFIKKNKPNEIYIAAAKVGGIHANNSYPGQFIYENLMIQSNLIHQSMSNGVQKLLFLGSSCIYPKLAPQPMPENSLLTGKLEHTNEPYAIAKIAGIKMCESYTRQYDVDYRSVMPTNLYGYGDNFHLEDSHVIPALIRRFHDAKKANLKEIIIWGSGKVKREFLFVDDMAEACIFIMNLNQSSYLKATKPQESHINIGSGDDITIKDLSFLIAKIVGFKGEIKFDISKPEGPPRKLMDSSLISGLGWRSKICLEEGLGLTYNYFIKNKDNIRLT
jgi:GDP-L-fucose synthase